MQPSNLSIGRRRFVRRRAIPFSALISSSQLSRIIISHTLSSSAQSTLQLLLETPTSLPEIEAGLFAAACSDIFEIMASSTTILDHTIAMRRLSGPLVSMLFIVGCSEKVKGSTFTLPHN